MKTVKDLFNLPDGSNEEITIYYYLEGSQGISSADGFIKVNPNYPIETFEQLLTEIRADLIADDYEDYVDYEYEEGDEEYDEYAWLQADQEGYLEAIADSGHFYFDTQPHNYRFILSHTSDIELNEEE